MLMLPVVPSAYPMVAVPVPLELTVIGFATVVAPLVTRRLSELVPELLSPSTIVLDPRAVLLAAKTVPALMTVLPE